jgi:hypothetical protein
MHFQTKINFFIVLIIFFFNVKGFPLSVNKKTKVFEQINEEIFFYKVRSIRNSCLLIVIINMKPSLPTICQAPKQYTEIIICFFFFR